MAIKSKAQGSVVVRQLMRPKEVAEKLAVSIPTVYTLRNRGELIGIDLADEKGSAVRFDAADVADFIERRKARY